MHFTTLEQMRTALHEITAVAAIRKTKPVYPDEFRKAAVCFSMASGIKLNRLGALLNMESPRTMYHWRVHLNEGRYEKGYVKPPRRSPAPVKTPQLESESEMELAIRAEIVQLEEKLKFVKDCQKFGLKVSAA